MKLVEHMQDNCPLGLEQNAAVGYDSQPGRSGGKRLLLQHSRFLLHHDCLMISIFRHACEALLYVFLKVLACADKLHLSLVDGQLQRQLFFQLRTKTWTEP
jgi:hypothetical protein